jgi:hypothetical protein
MIEDMRMRKLAPNTLTVFIRAVLKFSNYLGRSHPIVAALPPFIHLKGSGSSDFARLQTAINFMIHETRATKPGAGAVLSRLAGELFVQMARAYLEQA